MKDSDLEAADTSAFSHVRMGHVGIWKKMAVITPCLLILSIEINIFV